jgi:hypothetical protein
VPIVPIVPILNKGRCVYIKHVDVLFPYNGHNWLGIGSDEKDAELAL